MRVILPVGLAAVLVAGCTSTPPAQPPPSNAALPVFTTTTAPAPRGERTVPDSCGKVLTRDDLDRTLDSVVTGRTEAVVGVALQSIGRTGRIDCYYGVPEGQPNSAAVLTVGLAGYVDSSSALKRVRETVDAERDKGTAPVEVAVGADKGFLLDGTTRSLVVAHGKVTVSITATAALVPADRAADVLGALADRALRG
ncbi:hypothetical protein V5P93_004987 [Actinokineospora auranticolor]|uniref:DUF3558 domain-containing protein n=1 Tax=Actinokineospora auranticolor TaxID=155976 RepID=A0A2S6GAZ0_9PSEU|nr:hypothetical protein [Actinokineospora auranticolor]PPK60381.1 hypothetical protein CLV40_1554 [Actinokineospora auranticolor]